MSQYSRWPVLATGNGSVTSVGIIAPGIFNVSGSPVTTSGNITLTLANESANTVFAGPTTGAAAPPTFRSLVVADIPALPANQIPLATTSTDGYLSSTDWNTFNSKQATISATAPLVDTAGVLSIPVSTNSVDGYLSAADHTTFAAKQPAITPGTTSQYFRGDLTFQTLDTSVVPENTNLYFTTARVLSSISATAPIVDTAGVFSIPASTNSVDGYLTSVDHTTFSAKQAAGNYITALTGDVTATGPGSVAAAVAFVGGSTAAAVHTGELLANAATSANTASTIVLRDGSGNFSAGTITANLVGVTPGGAVTVTGGTADTVAGAAGGNATIAGAAGTSTTTGGAGGSANITGGNANGDNTASRNGGAVNVTAGNSKGSGSGGAVLVNGGSGGIGTGSGGSTGGAITETGGTGGAGSSTSGNGGATTFQGGAGGAGVAGGNGGIATLKGGTAGAGSSTGGNGGAANVTGGAAAAVAGSRGGTIAITTGTGTSTGTGGQGGALTISTGGAGGDNTVNQIGGTITISVGASKGSSTGSAITMTAGTGGVGTGTTGAAGGTTTVAAGDGGVGSSTGGAGGSLTLSAGIGGASGTPGAGGAIIFKTGATTTVTEHLRVSNAGDTLLTSGNLQIGTAGNGLQVKSGSNCRLGTAVLVAGTVTVSNTTITANSRILLTSQVDGGTPGFLRITATSVGTSFTITSSSNTDTSTVAWYIIEAI